MNRQFDDGGLTGRLVRPDDLTAAEGVRWRELCDLYDSLASPFFSCAFTRQVAKAHDGARVCVLERGGQPIGFLPFQAADGVKKLLSAAERIGGELSDYCGLVAPPELSLSPDDLLRLAGLSSFLVSHLEQSQPERGLIAEQATTGSTAVFGQDPDAYWQELKAAHKKFAARVERLTRRIIEQVGPLRFEYQVAERKAELDRIIEVKREQYRQTKVKDVLAEGWRRELLHNLSDCDDPQCQGVTSTLYAGDTWVAAHFGLSHGKLLHYWFPVYNIEMAKYSPGHLLIRHLMQHGAQHGVERLDFGAGDNPHKERYPRDDYLVYDGFWRRPGLRSFAFEAWLALEWRWSRLRS
ncbi:MAG: GNAT family N-acetyltransferase [Alphaproteobacteria bacterium]|jgi:CelD/BcsL family acetyltransferase involved in cellulose biosynthesis|nr:GNAT family N-acetyltransferase [Alphaproteobacteria bacterium]